MKKIYSYVGAAAVLITSNLFAQQKNYSTKIIAQPAGVITKSSNSNINKVLSTAAAAGDTVGYSEGIASEFLPDFFGSTSQLFRYGYTTGGYIFGKNADSLNMCAQGYLNLNSTSLVINKVIMWVYEKGNVGSSSSKIRVGLWTMAANKAINSTPTNTAGTLSSRGPSIQRAFVDVPWSSIDTSFTPGVGNAFTVATFTNPVGINGDFAISVNSQYLADGDSIGILANQNGGGQGLDLAFHKFALPNSTAVSTNWIVTDYLFDGLDVSLAMFAVLDMGTAVNEYVNGIKLNALYPNPTKDEAIINYSLEKSSNSVSLTVLNIHGQKVFEENYGSQNAGEYKIKLNTASLESGTYFYQLTSNSQTITKEFIITK